LTRDTTPAAISQIRQDGNSLLVTLSEPVLPVPDQAPGKDLVTAVPGTLADAFELTVNGTVLKPQVVFEEGFAPFGSVFRLSGFPPNTVGAMTVRVVGGKLVDTFGTLVADARMPFGLSPVPATGVPVGSTCSVGSRSAIGNPWLWQGQWFDYDVGLVYLRARHYDPQTGHFLQRDPMQYEDSVNLYAAMANNPATYRDPTGMGILDVFAKLVGTRARAPLLLDAPAVRKIVDSARKMGKRAADNVQLGAQRMPLEKAEDVLHALEKSQQLHFIGMGSAGLILGVKKTDIAIKTFFSRHVNPNGIKNTLADWDDNVRGFELFSEIGWMKFHGAHPTGEISIHLPHGFVPVNLGRPAFVTQLHEGLLDMDSVHGLKDHLGHAPPGFFEAQENAAKTFLKAIGVEMGDFQGGLVRNADGSLSARFFDPGRLGKVEFDSAISELRLLRSLGLKDSDIPGVTP
jgi:RHS repeat-associated protein